MSETIYRFLEPQAVSLGLKATTSREVLENLGEYERYLVNLDRNKGRG